MYNLYYYSRRLIPHIIITIYIVVIPIMKSDTYKRYFSENAPLGFSFEVFLAVINIFSLIYIFYLAITAIRGEKKVEDISRKAIRDLRFHSEGIGDIKKELIELKTRDEEFNSETTSAFNLIISQLESLQKIVEQSEVDYGKNTYDYEKEGEKLKKENGIDSYDMTEKSNATLRRNAVNKQLFNKM